eukprot:128339-Rhodomonas_salina.2
MAVAVPRNLACMAVPYSSDPLPLPPHCPPGRTLSAPPQSSQSPFVPSSAPFRTSAPLQCHSLPPSAAQDHGRDAPLPPPHTPRTCTRTRTHP